MQISQEAFNLIIAEEVTGKTHYEARLRRPEWPGGNSGVTIGIGYDLGMSSVATINADWASRVSPQMLAAMCSAAGIHGDAARPLAAQLRDQIDIPWDMAIDVFANHDVPKFAGLVRGKLPNTDQLSPDCFGALVSLAFNRGPSFDNPGDRYTEMRAIKAHMIARDFASIPAEFRSMKRLWPSLPGLISRREHEAVLFANGLAAAASPIAQAVPDDRKARIVKMQQKLAEGGFDPGAADGLIGSRTVKAVQRAAGLTGDDVNGVINDTSKALIEAALAAV